METITPEKRDREQLDRKQAEQLTNLKNHPEANREESANTANHEVYKRPNYLLRLL
jgi:hypothetical protein